MRGLDYVLLIGQSELSRPSLTTTAWANWKCYDPPPIGLEVRIFLAERSVIDGCLGDTSLGK